MKALICCEGPDCNGGHSALVRETAIERELPSSTQEMRDESSKQARGIVSRRLAVTQHSRSGTERRAGIAFARYACDVCGHERVYGNSVAFA